MQDDYPGFPIRIFADNQSAIQVARPVLVSSCSSPRISSEAQNSPKHLLDSSPRGDLGNEAADTSSPRGSGYLNNLGVRFGDRFEKSRQMADLDQAILCDQQALEATPADHPDRAKYLNSLGFRFHDRYERTGQVADLEQAMLYDRQALEAYDAEFGVDQFEKTGQVADLEQAILCDQQALEATPTDHPDRAKYLNSLGMRCHDKFQRTGQMADLKQAIQYDQQTLEATDHEKFGVVYRDDLFEKTGQMADLEQAISCDQHALEATPGDHTGRAKYSNSLGFRFHDRFERTGQMADLEQVIQSDQQALEATSANHPDRVRCLKNLMAGFHDRFEKTWQMDDLEQTIQYGQQALEIISADHPDRAECLNNLGVGFYDRFQTTEQMADLEQAIQYGQRALVNTPVNHSNRARRLKNLEIAFENRFRKTGQLVDLEQAIEYGRQQVQKTIDHQDREEYSNNLEIRLNNQFEKIDQTDLEQAIRYDQLALEALSANHPNRAKHLSNLEIKFSIRFRRTSKMIDLGQAIRSSQQALEATAADHPNYARRLNNLGVRFRDRFERTGEMADLEPVIQFGQQALETISANHPDRVEFLNNLGIGFRYRFERTGQMADLEQAIQYGQQALEATSANHLDHAECLNNLGIGFRARFERTKQMADLEQAIQYGQRALEATSADHPDRAEFLNNLGVGFRDRFERTEQMADLEQVIQYGQQALDIMSANHPDRATYLNNFRVGFDGRIEKADQIFDLKHVIQYGHLHALYAPLADYSHRGKYLHNLGVGFGHRFRKTNHTTDLEQAIQYGQQALEATPVDHPNRKKCLTHLGVRFDDRFKMTGQMTDLNQAIRYGYQALEITSVDHPDCVECCYSLGTRFYSLGAKLLNEQFGRTYAEGYFQCSTENFKRAFFCSSGAPFVRIIAGISAAKNLTREKKWNDAADLLEKVLYLLPDVTPLNNSRDDLQYILQQLSGLASFSASVFLKAGKPPVTALQALENSRGIIASLMINIRSDVSMLKEKYPKLWLQYTKCQEQIGITSGKRSFTLQTTFQQDYTARNEIRRQLFQTLEDIRNEIRQCSGFERFLLPLSKEEIQGLAQNGSIVTLNVSKVSSEAFVITTTNIQALSLPELKLGNIHSCVRLFASRGNPARRDATIYESDEDEQSSTPDMLTELQSLWKNVVKPILQRLGLLSQEKASSTLPRIYWVGGGMMALLPLHAAGVHTLGSTENTLSHVISSSVPTLKTLQFVQNKPSFSIREKRPVILVVSMPKTPGGYMPLKVSEEVAAITHHTGSWASTVVLEQPNRESVINILKSCSIAHFACHGLADSIEPAKNALLLGKEIEERLTVEDLDEIIHDNAQIGYLSACSTAEIKRLNLVDESIHLASSFQLAGFRHVIGTLRAADDSAAVEIAGQFYKGLSQHTKDDDTAVAQALHDAVLCFRNTKDNCSDIFKWAPFIHLGP